jgi:hypothetical protein
LAHPGRQNSGEDGMCAGQVQNESPRFVLCDCKSFVPKGEDASQAAVRIVREATENK